MNSPFPDNAAKLQGTHFVISTFMTRAGALSVTPDQACSILGVLRSCRDEELHGTKEGACAEKLIRTSVPMAAPTETFVSQGHIKGTEV